MGNRAPIMLPFVLALLIALPLRANAQTSDRDEARNRPGDFVINRPASLYAKPSADAQIIRQLHPRTVVRVVEVLDQWYKVESTKGHENGFVRRSYADPHGGGGGGGGGGGSGAGQGQRFRVGTFRLTDPVVVREQPNTSSPKLATLRAGAEVRVVDKDPSGLWYKIQSETGNRPPGWIPTQAAKRIEGR
jgi:Bacterial SH3 domain